MPQITHTTHHRDSGRWRPSTPDDIGDTRTHAIHFTAHRNLSEPVGAHHIKQKEPYHGQPLYRGAPLTAAEMETLFDELFAGTLPPEKLASLLTALIMRGATPPEIAGAARSMRRAALPFPTDRATGDVVGTGGDDAGTFNVSTTVALPAAGAGLPIVKNGNCGVSSPSGAADVLKALGVPVDLTPEEGLEALKATNFAFCFARNHHPAMRFAAPVRKCLEAPTLFNLLEPLSNPLGRGGPAGRDRPHRDSSPQRGRPRRAGRRGAGERVHVSALPPRRHRGREARGAPGRAPSRGAARNRSPARASRFRRRDDGGRPGCDRGGRRGRDFGLGRRAADRSGASRCRGRGAGGGRVRQGDEGGDEEVRE